MSNQALYYLVICILWTGLRWNVTLSCFYSSHAVSDSRFGSPDTCMH